MEEIWKKITDAKQSFYSVSNLGRIKVERKGQITIKVGHLGNKGYLHVTFGKSDRRNVHVIVANYFCEKHPGSQCVNHIDGNKCNNRADNLEWTTYAENNRHAYRNKLNNCHGENHHGTDLTIEYVRGIYELKKSGKRLHEVAKIKPEIQYGTLKEIYNGKNWRYEYEKFFGEKHQSKGRSGEVCGRSIPKEQVLKIYDLKKQGKNIAQISRELNVNYGTTKSIFNGKNWKHLYKEHFECPAILTT